MSLPRPRRVKAVHNYAMLNARGLWSLSARKFKPMLKSKRASPSSGVWRILDFESVEEETGVNNRENSIVKDVGHANETASRGKSTMMGELPANAMEQSDCECESNQQTIDNRATPVVSNKRRGSKGVFNKTRKSKTIVTENNLTETLDLQKSMSTLEERKQALRQRVAALRKQVQQEEDEEFKQLQREEEELLKKLNKQSERKEKPSKAGNGGSNIMGETCKVSNSSGLDAQNELKNLTGVTFDMSGFIGDNMGAGQEEVNDLLLLTEKKGSKKRKLRKTRRNRRDEESDSESSSESSSATDSEDECQTREHSKKKKGKFKSGLYDRQSDAQLVSNEWYAHPALDEAVLGKKSLFDLSFNLLVAGELEIIMSERIGRKKQCTRLEILKKLAYKHEFLPINDVLAQYKNFLQQVEKGKYAWGSKSSILAFEQQLMYNVSLERNRVSKKHR